ncbi:MAG: aminoacyl-tRNA hydrolase [bacterium]|nr:aminoacyl-tRNA hydrolase [bacterium]
MKLIVGLGNPGKEYKETRHNAGWEAVRLAAEKAGATFAQKTDFKGEIAEARQDGDKILFLHPFTFMNLSGESVSAVMRFYKIDLADLLIVHDEMDYPEQALAFSFNAGPGGHNGVISIQEHLGSNAFARLRLGIGRPTGPMDPADYVLQKCDGSTNFNSAVDAINDWVKLGTDKAMNIWNKTKPAS